MGSNPCGSAQVVASGTERLQYGVGGLTVYQGAVGASLIDTKGGGHVGQTVVLQFRQHVAGDPHSVHNVIRHCSAAAVGGGVINKINVKMDVVAHDHVGTDEVKEAGQHVTDHRGVGYVVVCDPG